MAGGAGAALVVASGFPLTSVAARARRDVLVRGGAFREGVAAGEPGQRGATLWTRVDGVEQSGRIAVEVASDPGFDRVVHRGLAKVASYRDATARVRVESKRLKPGREYWYRFATRSKDSPVGRFRTMRPPDSREPIRIGYFSCQRFEHGYFTPHAAMAAEDLDLVVSLGDYIYEEDGGVKVAERRDDSGRPNGHVETLAQFRARHRRYRSDPSLQAMHAAHPFLAIWDDCEVEGNWAGHGPSSGPSPVGERSVPFEEKRRNGFRSYFEYMPVRDIRRAGVYKLYRSLRMGANAELFLLDTRQYRDPQPCNDAEFQPCPEADDAGRKRLGQIQKEWLKQGLSDSAATWKVLGNAQMMMSLDLPPGQPIMYDAWDGYGAERRELLEHLVAKGVTNLTSIVGDVHTYFAGQLTTTGRIGGVPVGTEFVGTSVSHEGFGLPEMSEEESTTLTNQLPLANPHIRYAKFGVRGYAVMELRPDELRVDFKGVRSVLEPKSESYLVRSFRVASGQPDVELV